MKKTLIYFLSLVLFYTNSGIAMAVTQQAKVVNDIEIPRGTTVQVSFVSTVNSDRLYSGDTIPLSILDDVLVDNNLAFKKGARGTAEIEKVIRSGSHGRAGMIEIKNARIKDSLGNAHNVQLNILSKGQSRRPSAITLSVLGVLLILVPFGIWREGDPAYLSASQIYEAVIVK